MNRSEDESDWQQINRPRTWPLILRNRGFDRDKCRTHSHGCKATWHCNAESPHSQITSYQSNVTGVTTRKHIHKHENITPHTNTAVLASLCSYIASPCIREIPRCAVHNKQHAVRPAINFVNLTKSTTYFMFNMNKNALLKKDRCKSYLWNGKNACCE